MAEDKLTFLVHYENQQIELKVNRSQTFGHLKEEIARKFKLDPAKLTLDGWNVWKCPESDSTILGTCCRYDITCLNVQYTVTNEDHEIEAIRRFKEKLADSLFNVPEMSLATAFNCGIQQKGLLLFFYSELDIFSQQFLVYATYDEMSSILNHSFTIIGWNVEYPNYHKALIEALRPFDQLSFAHDWIQSKIGGLICFIPENGQMNFFSCLKGDVEYTHVLQHLKNAEQLFIDSGETEIHAIESFQRQLPSDSLVRSRISRLDEAIEFICTAPLNQRKILLLYLHNSDTRFSQGFTSLLRNPKLAQVLNRSFILLGWDVQNPNYHEALVSALNNHISLKEYAHLITKKIGIGFCIMPLSGTINVCLCLQGDCTLSNLLTSLCEIENNFNEEMEKEKELRKLEEKGNKETDLGSQKLQAIWADMLGDRDYDSFEHSEWPLLLDKIKFALRGPPKEFKNKEGKVMWIGYEKKDEKLFRLIFDTIIKQSNEIAEFKDYIEISFIYNCLEPLPKEKIRRAAKYSDYNPVTDVNPVPVFILRKCRCNRDGIAEREPCRVFIDHTGRVYQNWNEYLTKNKFPECEMIVPRNGRYIVEDNQVLLDRYLSPACQLDSKLLQVGDYVGMAAGFSSGAVFITAAAGIAAVPVAAPVLVAAGVAGVGAGIWGMARSISTLVDRSRHKQSLSFLNSEARGAYLNIVAGSLGFVGAGANVALTQMISRGVNVGKGTTYALNAIGVLNVSAGGASLINSGYDILDQWIREGETPSTLTLIQLGSSVLFFGHAVYSFRGAQTVIDETQAKVLQEYQNSLRSNRHRKTFSRLMRETVNNHSEGSQAGRAEVISAIRNIPNKDEVFAALTRNKKAMSKVGLRYSAADGQILVGGMPVDYNEFIGLNKKQAEVYFNDLSQNQSQTQPTTVNNPNTNNSDVKTAIISTFKDLNIDVAQIDLAKIVAWSLNILSFCQQDVRTIIFKVTDLIVIKITEWFKGVTSQWDEIIPTDSQYTGILQTVFSVFSRMVDELEEQYQRYLSSEKLPTYYNPIFEIVNLNYIKRAVEFFEFIVRNSYSAETLALAVLNRIMRKAQAWVARTIFEYNQKKEKEEERKDHSASRKIKLKLCPICFGYYYQPLS